WAPRDIAAGLSERCVIGIGRVGSGAAVFHVRLKPVEFRRGRRHVGIGFSRGAVGLGGSATEIVGVGGDGREAAHARRRRGRRQAVFGTAAGATISARGRRRQDGILHR